MKVVKSCPNLHLDAGFLHFEHFAGHDRALLDVARLGEGSPSSCLTPSEDALLFDIDVEHHALTMSPFLKLSMTCSPEASSRGRTDDHAVDVAVETEEQTELGLVLDLASTVEPTGNFSTKTPGVARWSA